MRKSVWLLSAGLFALSTSGFCAGQTRRPAQPTEPSADRAGRGRARGAGRGRRRPGRDHRHRPGPPPGPAGRSDRRHRGRRRGDAEFRRDRHPPAQPARAVAARLLDRHRSQRLGPYPRHRHGRRQSRPRKLGRGVHRRRLSLALRHRPQRAWRDRPGRGAARTAGHLVRPQRLGRPHQHHHASSRRYDFEGYGEATIGNYDLRRVAGGVTGADRRRLAARLDGSTSSATASTTIVSERHRRSTTATASSPAASCCSSRTTTSRFRLIGDYTQAQGTLLRRGLSSTTTSTDDRQPQRAANPLTAGASARPRRQQYHQCPARPRARISHAFARRLRPRHLGHAGPQLRRARPRTGAFRCEVDYDFGGGELTSITAYRDYKSGQAGDFDYSTVDILYRADDGVGPPVQDLQPGTAAPGQCVQRQARLAGRRLFRRRGPDAHRQSRFGSQYGRFATCRIVSPAALPALYSPGSPACVAPCRGRSRRRPPFGAAGRRPSSQAFDRLDALNDLRHDRRHLQPEQPQLGAVHPQHLPRHRPVRCDRRPSLHQRAQEIRRDLRQRQHGLHGATRRARVPSPRPIRRSRAAGRRGHPRPVSCQGNSTAELNGVSINDKRKREQVHRHRRAVLQAERRPAALRAAIRAAIRRAASTSTVRR